VDVHFKSRFGQVLSLEELRAHAELAGMLILRRGNRLSVTPVTADEAAAILKMGSR
jgi:predicted RNA-binding protein with PUA-like domain